MLDIVQLQWNHKEIVRSFIHFNDKKEEISINMDTMHRINLISIKMYEIKAYIITKPTKSRTAQFYATARNRSACVIFRFQFILKNQSFFYILLKFGNIKRIISSGFCCFSTPMFFRSDIICNHCMSSFILL